MAIRPKRKSRDDTEMDITPMIDVTFLLLIFFIVASKMDPQKATDLPEARHGLAAFANTAAVFIISKGTGDNVKIFKGLSKTDDQLIGGDLIAQEKEIQDFVTTELSQEPVGGQKKKNSVLILAEKGFKYRHVDRVLKAAADVLEDEHTISVAVMEQQ